MFLTSSQVMPILRVPRAHCAVRATEVSDGDVPVRGSGDERLLDLGYIWRGLADEP